MEIKNKDNFCIITPLSPKLDKRESLRLEEEIENNLHKQIGLDLSFVKDCTIEFIDTILKIKNISLFNIHSDIFSLFLSMNMDKTVNLYVSEMDFEENRHKLLNRKFYVL